MYRSAGNQQQVQGQGPPAVPQNGPVMYGSGLVFGGNVYPVLVDGVPMQPPVGAHQAAVQQRMMLQQRPQAPHPPKPLTPQPPFQRVGARAGTSFRAKQTPPQNQQAFGRFAGAAAGPGPGPGPAMTQYNNHAMMQRLQQLQQLQQHQQLQQQQQQQQLAAMGCSYGSCNFNYNMQPSAGGDCSASWNGYAMMQPSDANKPYTFGWSPSD